MPTFDWTINLGQVTSVLVFVGGLVWAFIRLQSKVTSLEERFDALVVDLEDFKVGLKDFREDFRRVGDQVVEALVKIAHIEGQIGNGRRPQETELRSGRRDQ